MEEVQKWEVSVRHKSIMASEANPKLKNSLFLLKSQSLFYESSFSFVLMACKFKVLIVNCPSVTVKASAGQIRFDGL